MHMEILDIATAFDASETYPRASEGAMVELTNGDLFMVFQRFEKSRLGSADDAPNALVSMRSSDGGRSWNDLRVEAVPEPGDVNVYSPNLMRLEDGSVLFVYKRYVQLGAGKLTLCTAVACTSTDECATFTGHRVLWEREPHGFASATIRRLRGGRLILPVSATRKGTSLTKEENIEMGCVASDDHGASWHVCPGWIVLPMRGAMEGHVAELADGRLMMVMRTQLGAVFKSFSSDRGETWSKAQTTGLRAPESCPELVRLPERNALVLVWNNSEYDPAFRSHYGKRTPLSVAVSTDSGDSFQHVGDIETEPGWAYSNPGALFLTNGTCVLNYWAVKYTPSWVMTGLIHLKVARFKLI